MKNYNVIFSPSFIQMLENELRNCITFSSSYAKKTEKVVFESIKLLQQFPFIASIIKFPNLKGNYRKFIIQKRYLIIFRIFNSSIHLDYFIDGRQAQENYFKIP